MDIAKLKRKLRELRQLEEGIRQNALSQKTRKRGAPADLIWNRFFSTRNAYDRTVKYSMQALLRMDHEKRKEAFEEFFYHLYYQKFTESGVEFGDILDPALLAMLGLPPHAGITEVRGKFRQLAMKYHPDHGGNHDDMIHLLDIYGKLMDEKK